MANNLQLYPKAYFNWVRLKWEHSPSFSIEPWHVEDYRELSIETLFDRLANLGLSLTEENFLMMAEAYQGPEEFTHYLWSRKGNEMPIYLILFELWRRLLPEKESLSIFFDELDNRIRSYLKDSSQDHGISNALQRLEEILEESNDLGENPRAIFASLARHVAHDLEAFLFDYISDQIDVRSDLEAAELIRTFYPYMLDTLCFDFLNARLLILMDPHEGNLAFKKLLGQLAEAPDPDLLLEVAAFLIHHSDPHLFQKASRLCLENVQTEEDFQELLSIVADYCHFVEKDQAEKQIQEVFSKRLGYSAKASLKTSDPDISFLRKILEDTEWAKI
jgi:hypothetical protein